MDKDKAEKFVREFIRATRQLAKDSQEVVDLVDMDIFEVWSTVTSTLLVGIVRKAELDGHAIFTSVRNEMDGEK